jgi:hypothetical protein
LEKCVSGYGISSDEPTSNMKRTLITFSLTLATVFAYYSTPDAEGKTKILIF